MSQLLDISDEELEQNIDITKNEIKGYHLLSEGFLILSNIPTSNEFKNREYYWKYIKYENFEIKANEILQQLLDLKRQKTDKNLPLTDI